MRRLIAVATVLAASPGAMEHGVSAGASHGLVPQARAGSSPSVVQSFKATVSVIPPEIRTLMVGRSWHRGCPVAIKDLRLIRLRYWGFDRRAHWGRLVVRHGWGNRMATVFHRLYDARFPIRKVWLVDRFGGNDMRSMKADNTSAFNCRWRAGQPGVWSEHAYGRAIDVNPLENPYVTPSHVSPPAGRRFLDRSMHRKGMIHKFDVAWRAFRRIGWKWGIWPPVYDYQHFSSTGQ